jgi:signal transduction histidine kinase
MGGAVRVESELGQGTTFIMTLKTKCLVIPMKNQEES